MLLLSACLCLLCLLCLVPLSEAYGIGPPVNTVVPLCTDMVPTGHGATKQTVASPFEVVTNQNCYKQGLKIQVIVRTPAVTYDKIAGLFVQAREVGTGYPIGTFDVGSDTDLSTLSCQGLTPNSAVGHNKVKRTYYRSMLWTPPPSFTGNVKFRATVVKDQATFWVGLESPEVTYSTSCIAAAQIANTRGSGTGTTLRAAPYCLALALMSFLVAILAQ